jgi:hypothetical protein
LISTLYIVFYFINFGRNEHKPIRWKKERIKGPSVSLSIFEVSILFILYYFVFMVSHHVSFNNSIDPYLCFNQIELYIYLFYFFKKKIFFTIFFICALHKMFFFYFILFNKFYVCFNFCYKLILINNFVKHNRVNDPCCDIKYLDLHLSLNLSNYIFIYC